MPVNPLTLTVKDRNSVIFSGDVLSITSYNDAGKFDVLSKHANFISLIKKDIEIRLKTGETKVFEIGNGILKVQDNLVNIYLGIGKSPTI
jgi:F0F1-type ATP synthase epsilon subunit